MRLLSAALILIHANLCSSFKINSYQKSYVNRNALKMSAANQADYALLFDCDGVIVETEVLFHQAEIDFHYFWD